MVQFVRLPGCVQRGQSVLHSLQIGPAVFIHQGNVNISYKCQLSVNHLRSKSGVFKYIIFIDRMELFDHLQRITGFFLDLGNLVHS